MLHHKTVSGQVLPFFVTIPHSGELLPAEAGWLHGLPEPHLMRDVDRYVDKLYVESLKQLSIPHIVAECHRYVIDLNRLPGDFDAQAVLHAVNPVGTHPKGLHWCMTTMGEPLITTPMTLDQHKLLVLKYYQPFHDAVKDQFAQFSKSKPMYHLDAHSMPSRGTKMHNDPGENRADIVVSDFHGKSCRKEFTEIVIEAYKAQGFSVSYNWPYFGGGITQMYGKPELNQHTLQVELNRQTYMNEDTKKIAPQFAATQAKIASAIKRIQNDLSTLKD